MDPVDVRSLLMLDGYGTMLSAEELSALRGVAGHLAAAPNLKIQVVSCRFDPRSRAAAEQALSVLGPAAIEYR